ncbi:MAG: glycosyltransferase [Nitrospira sp.]|nr:glycosyltransferase [Nitrospira sp.]
MAEYARAWVALLLRRQWEVGICATNELTATLPQEVHRFLINGTRTTGARLYRALSIASLLNLPPASSLVRKISAHISAFNPAAVHFVDRSAFTAYLLDALSTKFHGISFIHTLHDPQWHEERISKIGGWLKHRDYLWSASLDQRPNVFMHVHDRRLLRETIFQRIENVLEMPHPLPSRVASRMRREIATTDVTYPIRLGFLGRIEPYKGLDVFCDAVTQSLYSGRIKPTQIEIVIAGRGHIDEIRWNKLGCVVEFHNDFILDEQFHQLMADLDVLVLPYISATQSGVGMMGAAYGIPIVASRVGALDQLVADGTTGILVTPGDAEDLGYALAKLIESPHNLQRLWQHTRARVFATLQER